MLGSNKFTRLNLLVLVVIVLLGLIKLPQPFMGDQAWFTLVASKMSEGGVIYRDVWDVKQPAIFGFYLFGGNLFGFNEVGIHAFELFYMAIFSMVMMFALKDYFENRVMTSLPPLFTVGVYYGIAEVWHQTQVEALVGFPLFLTLWFALQASEPTKKQWAYAFASGMLGAIVLLFKLIYLPIIAVFWLVALVERADRKKIFFARFSISAALGALTPLLAVTAYFIHNNLLDIVYWTYFVYPLRVMEEMPSNFSALEGGVSWFTNNFSSLMALATLGFYTSLLSRRQWATTLKFLLWLLLGFGVIIVQGSWFQYHFLLLLIPLGVLAAKGIDASWAFVKEKSNTPIRWRDRIVLMLILLFLFSHALGSLARSVVSLIRHDFAITREQRIEYQIAVDSNYDTVIQETKFLSESSSLSGDIYIFGDPLYYFLSGRDPAIPLPALWFRALPEQWEEIMAFIEKEKPVYIFITVEAFDFVRNESSPAMVPYLEQTIRLIERDYQILNDSDSGTWYVLRTSKRDIIAGVYASMSYSYPQEFS